MLPASVPPLPLFTITLSPVMASVVAMSAQLRLAPLAVAVNVVVPGTTVAVTPNLGLSESVRSNAGRMRASRRTTRGHRPDRPRDEARFDVGAGWIKSDEP